MIIKIGVLLIFRANIYYKYLKTIGEISNESKKFVIIEGIFFKL